jgi:hypothetical protein
MAYTMTINTVPAGTTLADDTKSLTGHMWITLTDENGTKYDYGKKGGQVLKKRGQVFAWLMLGRAESVC